MSKYYFTDRLQWTASQSVVFLLKAVASKNITDKVIVFFSIFFKTGTEWQLTTFYLIVVFVKIFFLFGYTLFFNTIINYTTSQHTSLTIRLLIMNKLAMFPVMDDGFGFVCLLFRLHIENFMMHNICCVRFWVILEEFLRCCAFNCYKNIIRILSSWKCHVELSVCEHWLR